MNLDYFEKPKNLSGEKALIHFWNHFYSSDISVYADMLTIWLSKIDLVNRHSDESSMETERAWIDASLGRMNYRRSNWFVSKVSIPRGKIGHYDSRMKCYGVKIPLNASFLSGTLDAWPKLAEAFNDSLVCARQIPYAHDEETVLADCIAKYPDFFHCVGNHYRQKDYLINFYGKVRRSIRTTYDLVPERRSGQN